MSGTIMNPTRGPEWREDLEHRAILTPPEIYAGLDSEFHFTFDPCPWPKPEGYDGLSVSWGESNYVNPLFWSGGERGKGVTAWVRKALAEADLGHTTVLVIPLDNWAAMLIERLGIGELRVRRDWRWIVPATGERKKPSRPVILWIVGPQPKGDRT